MNTKGALTGRSLHAWVAAAVIMTWVTSCGAAALPPVPEDGMAVTLLGTGDPIPSETRNGPSTLIEAGGLKLLVDAGRGATVRLNQIGLWPGQIDAVFITHFHSDHLNGLPDLWTLGYLGRPNVRRAHPFAIWGPTGMKRIAGAMRESFADDVRIRLEDEKVSPEGVEIAVEEFTTDGVVFERNGVRVSAFAVNHGPFIKPAFGYRVDYRGRSVLLSGDTRFDENLIAHGQNVDLLVHEVAVAPDVMLASPTVRAILAHHTTPEQAGLVFARTNPKKAVFSHITLLRDASIPPVEEAEILRRARTNWSGDLMVGADLMRFLISGEGVSTWQIDPHSGAFARQ